MLFPILIRSFSKSVKNIANPLKMASFKGKSLAEVIQRLEEFSDPKTAAENWDNTGLLLEPYKKVKPVEKILLTNDLTLQVFNEAISKKIDMIISYHPLIFSSLKRITQSNWKEKIISGCLSEGIALYSPHTAWDTVKGGVNDWLASALPMSNIKPIMENANMPPGSGAGRIFETDITLGDAIARVQKYIGCDIHVALGVNHSPETRIKSVAVCAGSGAQLLSVVKADLYLTGEMSHHTILDANQCNTSVILCNHSNSERGFLKVFQPKLSKLLNGDCEIIVSENDVDPLKTTVIQK